MQAFRDGRTSDTFIKSLKMRDGDTYMLFRRELEEYIRGVLRRHGAPPSEQEELLQDVLSRVWEKIGQFDPSREKSSFRGWLRTLTFNLLMNYFRGAGRQVILPPEALEQWRDPGEDQIDQMLEQRYGEIVQQIDDETHKRVPERKWEVFRHRSDGQTLEDIALALELSVDTVAQYASTVGRLRECIAKDLFKDLVQG